MKTIKELIIKAKENGVNIIEEGNYFFSVNIPVEDGNYLFNYEDISIHGDNLPPFFVGKCLGGGNGIYHYIEGEDGEFKAFASTFYDETKYSYEPDFQRIIMRFEEISVPQSAERWPEYY